MSVSAMPFAYVPRDSSLGNASLAPMLPIVLSASQIVQTNGLLDSGAAVNVLPYSLGLQLGFDWDQATKSIELIGNLASVEARVIVLSATIASFPAVRLAFAWTMSESVPVILGQVNFFMEYEVCFFRAQSRLEVRPKRNT